MLVNIISVVKMQDEKYLKDQIKLFWDRFFKGSGVESGDIPFLWIGEPSKDVYENVSKELYNRFDLKVEPPANMNKIPNIDKSRTITTISRYRCICSGIYIPNTESKLIFQELIANGLFRSPLLYWLPKILLNTDKRLSALGYDHNDSVVNALLYNFLSDSGVSPIELLLKLPPSPVLTLEKYNPFKSPREFAYSIYYIYHPAFCKHSLKDKERTPVIERMLERYSQVAQ